MHISKWKEPIWNHTYCTIPSTWHSGKGKTSKQNKNTKNTKELQIIYVDFLSTRWNSQHCKCELLTVTTFQRGQYGNGMKKSDLQWSNVDRSTLIVTSYVPSIYAWYDVLKMALYLCGLPPNTSLIIREISDKFPLRDILQNTWLVLFKILKATKSKESLRNCHIQEKPKETWWLNVMWSPGWDAGTEKWHDVKTKEIWTKFGP